MQVCGSYTICLSWYDQSMSFGKNWRWMKDNGKAEEFLNFEFKRKISFVNEKNGKEDNVQGKGWSIGQCSMSIDHAQLVLKRIWAG